MSRPGTRPSEAIPGHIHTCASDHATGDHMCSDQSCRRWFGVTRDTLLADLSRTREADQAQRLGDLLARAER